MRISCIISFILFTACSNRGVDKTKVEMYTKVDTLKSKLIGRWGGLGEDSAVWEIGTDSIYYFQHRKAYPYNILNSDLIIKLDESKAILRNIAVIEDTMTFEIHDSVIANAYRFKTQK